MLSIDDDIWLHLNVSIILNYKFMYVEFFTRNYFVICQLCVTFNVWISCMLVNMTEILPIRRKTLSNQSINNIKLPCPKLDEDRSFWSWSAKMQILIPNTQ